MAQLPKNLSKFTIILIVSLVLLLVGGYLGYQRFIAKPAISEAVEEVDLPFDPEGPYALLYPRRDGNALILNIKRTASYDQIKYELSYNSEGVDRGAQGDINTNEKKGEYEQEILFGSCSTGGKCVYDKGVENGTLILHIRKENSAYRIVTQWHLQQPDQALGALTSGDNHFSYKIDSESPDDLAVVKYTIINDLSGAPKLPTDKLIASKVYAINTPIAKVLPKGSITLEMAEKPVVGSKIARFDEASNKWVEYETKIDGSKLTAIGDNSGVFTVLSPKK